MRQPLTLPSPIKGHAWPEPLPFCPFFFLPTSYLPLNPALGREFSREFSLCGVFPNTVEVFITKHSYQPQE
jgi:hypothetical protein